jgi:hypothetical protein
MTMESTTDPGVQLRFLVPLDATRARWSYRRWEVTTIGSFIVVTGRQTVATRPWNVGHDCTVYGRRRERNRS